MSRSKEERKAYMKAYYQAHREQCKEEAKAYYKAHREQCIEHRKAYNKAHREQSIEYQKAYNKAHREQYNEYSKSYTKSDLNSLGQTKASIRKKSRQILKQKNLHIPGYQTHHCFTYDDPAKFIYISRSLHLKIHQYLRDNNIDADVDHWMAIRDIVMSTDEFKYIMC